MNLRVYELHADICKIFSNAKRLEILNALRKGEKTVSELSKITKLSQTNLSQHLSVLRHRKVVIARKDGRNTYYRISNPKIIKACDLMREVLYDQLRESDKLVKIMMG